MKIIPAIDLIGGKCVRLTQGDYAQKKVYNEHPLEVAQQFEDAGIQHLHLVDLDGAKSGHIVNHKVLELITTRTQLKVDFGGGVKSDLDIKKAVDCGAQQVTCGSIAVKNEEIVEEWIELFGPERLILGADVKNKKVAIHGWMEETAIYFQQDIIILVNCHILSIYPTRRLRARIPQTVYCPWTTYHWIDQSMGKRVISPRNKLAEEGETI